MTPASVSAMVKKLDERGLVRHVRYKGVALTPDGRAGGAGGHAPPPAAGDLPRRAPRRAVGSRARGGRGARARALGVPGGADRGQARPPDARSARRPDPDRDLEIVEEDSCRLSELEAGDRGRFVRVSDSDPAMLRYLDERGVRAGRRARGARAPAVRRPADRALRRRRCTCSAARWPARCASNGLKHLLSSAPSSRLPLLAFCFVAVLRRARRRRGRRPTTRQRRRGPAWTGSPCRTSCAGGHDVAPSTATWARRRAARTFRGLRERSMRRLHVMHLRRDELDARSRRSTALRLSRVARRPASRDQTSGSASGARAYLLCAERPRDGAIHRAFDRRARATRSAAAPAVRGRGEPRQAALERVGQGDGHGARRRSRLPQERRGARRSTVARLGAERVGLQGGDWVYTAPAGRIRASGNDGRAPDPPAGP